MIVSAIVHDECDVLVPHVVIAAHRLGPSIFVVNVSAGARLGAAAWQRNLWSLGGKEAPASHLMGSLATPVAGRNAHGVMSVHDAVHLYRAAGQSHFRLNPLAEEPG
ncbi:MAG: hypothetical protein WBM03_01235 [Steroidobacteraceae bacterium]